MVYEIFTFIRDRTVEQLLGLRSESFSIIERYTWDDIYLKDNVLYSRNTGKPIVIKDKDKVVIRYDWRSNNNFLVDFVFTKYKKQKVFDVACFEEYFPMFTDKHYLWELIENSNIPLPQPKSVLYPTIDAIHSSHINFPIIAKKRVSGWAAGVYLIRDINELKEFLAGKSIVDYIFQDYLELDKDIRATVVKGEFMGAEERSVLFPNGKEGRVKLTGNNYDLPKDTITAVESIAKLLKGDLLGIDLGIDTQGHTYLIEVNISPGFRSLGKARFMETWNRLLT